METNNGQNIVPLPLNFAHLVPLQPKNNHFFFETISDEEGKIKNLPQRGKGRWWGEEWKEDLGREEGKRKEMGDFGGVDLWGRGRWVCE